MKIMKLAVLVAFFGSALNGSGMRALAEDYPQRTASLSSSLAQGLPRSAVPRLLRVAGVAGKAQAALLAVICPSGCPSAQPTQTGIRYEAPDWTLDVEGDGSVASYSNTTILARARSLAVPRGQHLTTAALEAAGRAFIAKRLSAVVKLAPGEVLVPIRAAHRIEGGQDLNSGAITDNVVASRVVFGRMIQGIPVVGGGSTVTITFINDGTVAGFRYDWPSYSADQRTNAAAQAPDILARLQQVVATRQGVLRSSSVASASAYPVALVPGSELQELECGYFDPGLNNRSSAAPVQSGCVYHVVSRNSLAGDTVAALAGAVPAALNIESDSSWPEALLLATP